MAMFHSKAACPIWAEKSQCRLLKGYMKKVGSCYAVIYPLILAGAAAMTITCMLTCHPDLPVKVRA